MRLTLRCLICCLIAATICFASDPPWKGKPYDQWNDKDLQKIFSDSPWARMATITRTWNSASGGSPNSTAASDPRRTSGGGGAASRGGQQGGGSNAPDIDDVNFYVHWVSSRVMRAASARRAVIQGQKNIDVAKYVSQPQEEYQISVQSDDMSPFARHDENFYKQNSMLELKKSKTKLPASNVRFERDTSGAVTTTVFLFPKKTASGEATIPADEKNAEFSCKIEGATLRVSFELQKMADNQGPDL